MLQANDKAPKFEALNQQGNTVKLTDFKGKKLAIYFYPKDDTPGCTAQACNIRDNFSLLNKKGITVLGVSVDDAKKHNKFIDKYELPFTLLADTEKIVVEAFGVWGEKKFMGKTYMGTNRVTFLINEKGVVEHVIEKVDTKEHTAQILEIWGLG
jgi:thioredoxin-dependent peroxiredoxin